MKKLLEYNLPEDIQTLTPEELKILSSEIRDFLVESVSKTGGHLASNLGVVELTLALFKVFDFKNDKIVWDVGHQSYIYKILTNRAEQFNTLRQLDGLSGFPKTGESEYDFFDTGHSSNSISVITGLACGRDLKGEDHQVISVIGDGSLTGGMAYEGLNNLGAMKKKAIVILNDNGMSIDKNTGSVNNHLAKLRTSQGYLQFKQKLRGGLTSIPKIGEGLYRGLDHIKDTVKAALVDGIFFEHLGFTYLGPIDGHDIGKIVEALSLAKDSEEPVVVHLITQKGKGYSLAEKEPDKFHGIGPFNLETGQTKTSTGGKTYSQVFGETLATMGKKNPKIVAVSAAMIEGTGLSPFRELFPDRIFDVGIAEQHAVTFAGGLAKTGLKPFVSIYSSFLQRGYDQIIMDIALQKVPVTIAVDRAGVVGADGETHHGIFDLSYLNNIPNINIYTPSSEEELIKAMNEAATATLPSVIRYPKGTAHKKEAPKNPPKKHVEILTCGNMFSIALASEEILKKKKVKAGVHSIEKIKPLDEKIILSICENVELIITLEDNLIIGGFGQQVGAVLNKNGFKGRVLNLGWNDDFVPQGSVNELLSIHGLDAQGVADTIERELD